MTDETQVTITASGVDELATTDSRILALALFEAVRAQNALIERLAVRDELLAQVTEALGNLAQAGDDHAEEVYQ
jgi:hypothetical protein